MVGKMRIPLLLAVFGLFALVAIPSVSASGETISANSTATTELKTATAINGITINGTDDSTVPVKLLVTNGTLSMTTTTGLTFKDASGNTLSNPQTGSTLYFSGARSDVNAALATLRYTRSTTGTDTLEMSLVNPGEVFFSGTGHLYEYVSSTLDWNSAKTAASGRTKYGATGYLATITSQAENDFVSARLLNAGWMGASDSVTEGSWKWVTGPENGTLFCIGTNPCNAQSGQYTNWNSGEPNDSGGNEDCGQFLAGGTGKWNDLPCSGTTLPGYVVEYGATGNMPTVAAANIAITTSDTIAPATPGTPTATSPTTDTTPTVSWTASSDSGTGLKSPAYTLEWSTSSTFASLSGSTTTNSTSLSPPALADGTWYFRVKATDNANNIATSAISSAVVIDTTAPTTPGTPSVGAIYTNDSTPTWNWTASTDSGVGLATPDYYVQWSTDPTLSGLNGQSNAFGNSYTIPDYLPMADGTWYFRVMGLDALGNSSAFSGIGSVIVDTVAPVISDVVSADGASSGQETITWTTDENSSSIVSYGPTTSLGMTTAETDTSTRIKNHSVTLTNLVPCSIYHFTVASKDAAGNTATSSDQSFITAGCAGSADVVAHTDTPITTSSGGSMNLDTINVNVPSGFASNNADFQIKKINQDPALGAIGMPAGMLLAGTKVYDIKALQDGTTAITSFNKPITITLHYDDADIAEIGEASLAIYRWDPGTGWTKLNDCVVDAAANTVTCTTTHFSTFALYGESKAAIAAANTIENKNIGSAYAGTNDAKVADTNTADQPVVASDESADTPVPAGQNNAEKPDKENLVVQQSNQMLGVIWWCVGGLAATATLWWFLAAIRRRRKAEH
jgi:hypothetical protein